MIHAHRRVVSTARYMWAGILCGLCLVCAAWSVDSWQHQARWSLWLLYAHNPLHWLVASAPLVLGVVGFQYGKARHHQRQAQHQHTFTEAVLQTVDCLVVVIDRHGQVLRFNRACEHTTGYTAAEVIGRSFADLFLVPEEQDDVLAMVERLLAGETTVRYQNVWRTKTNHHRMIAWSNTALRDAGGRIQYLIGTGVDVTEQQQGERERQALVQQLREQATIDVLTGTANRRHFWAAATELVHAAHAAQHPVSVLMLDIDHFKRVNDTYGHTSGDEVLRMVAQRCRAHLRDGDLLARYGGEEFVVALPNTALAAAQEIAERLRCAIADTPVRTTNGSVSITISGGVAEHMGTAHTFDALVAHADRALYQAKERGRNCIVALPNTDDARTVGAIWKTRPNEKRPEPAVADPAS